MENGNKCMYEKEKVKCNLDARFVVSFIRPIFVELRLCKEHYNRLSLLFQKFKGGTMEAGKKCVFETSKTKCSEPARYRVHYEKPFRCSLYLCKKHFQLKHSYIRKLKIKLTIKEIQ